MDSRLLIVDVAALGWELVRQHGLEVKGLDFAPAETVFPAVTCTVQASFRTARPPAEHGMIANGLYFPALRKVMFWEQSAGLVVGERIWSGVRGRRGKAGVLFWQQSMGEDADVLLTPAPIHKHHGGMIQDCYGRPEWLYREMRGSLDEPFKLQWYWGPLAGARAGDWIVRAVSFVLGDPRLAPDVCLAYLPTLDYDLQRAGPGSEKAAKAVEALREQLDYLLSAADRTGYEVIVFGDYAIAEVTRPAVRPNLALRDAGLFHTRTVGGRLYPDFHTSRAFAVADHEIAHVYVADEADVEPARQVLANTPGIAEVLDAGGLAERGADHPNAGQLLLVAEDGGWLAYPWWTRKKQAPDFATHVDIHNKPGFDPCELFFGWPPMSVSQDTARVRGTHGRAGAERRVAWASTCPLGGEPASLLDLAGMVRTLLDEAP